jgi:hypothetical protein
MDTRTVYEVPSWINSDALADLIDQLKEAGYNIGVSQYITAQKLILTLLDQEQTLDSPEHLCSFLGPIFCSSPIEQEGFPNQFNSWIDSLRHTHQLPVEARQKVFGLEDSADVKAQALLKKLENIGSGTRRLKGVVFLTAIAVICLLTILFRKSLHSTPTPPQQAITPKPSVSSKPSISPTSTISPEKNGGKTSHHFFFRWPLILIAVSMLATVIFVLWRIWWFQRAHLFLQRLSVMQEPELQKISIQEFEHHWFPRIHFTHIARGLKRRVRVPSYELDEIKTIDATLRQGEWFSPVYHTYQTPVEYLFLINRASFRDHQARWVDEMIDFLKRDGVFVAKYYFEANPLICFGDTVESPPKELSEIKNQYNQHCLVIVSDAHIFFSAIDGELVPWITQFETWAKRTILTPSPIGNWVSHEFILAQQFIVLPATAQGLYILSQILNPDTANTYIVSEEDKEPLPDPLLTRPLRWIERDPPASDQVEAMLKLIQQYLGKAGFYWFCACAVFPELHWNITLYLGNLLKTTPGETLLEQCEPARLARLPWFRYAYMPDWLRMRLILTLTTSQQSEIRSALQDLLITSVQGSANKQQLEVAQNYRHLLPELVNSILRRLSRWSSKSSPFRDHLFLRFMNGQPLLASKVPEEFRYLLKLYTRRIIMSDQKNNEPVEQKNNQSQRDRFQVNSTNSTGSSITKLLEFLLRLPGAAQTAEVVTKNFLAISISSLVGIGIGIGTRNILPLPPWFGKPPEITSSIDPSWLHIDMNIVCQNPKYYGLKKGEKTPSIAAATAVENNNDGKTWPVYSWKCRYLDKMDSNTPKYVGLDLNLYCKTNAPGQNFAANYLHYNDSKSWYCVNPDRR